jgi:predicted amidohydrolase
MISPRLNGLFLKDFPMVPVAWNLRLAICPRPEQCESLVEHVLHKVLRRDSKYSRFCAMLAAVLSIVISLNLATVAAQEPEPAAGTRRVAAAQAKRRSIDWRLSQPSDALAAVDRNLDDLEKIVHQAGAARCDALALPEDTLGLLDWFGMNETAAKEVLPVAVKKMLERLGRAAAEHRMFLVVCSDVIEPDGAVHNTAFFLGRDGQEIGRYHKVCPTWSESGARERGKSFPVFPTPGLGTVGMLICYDLVMPETARCLALQGADIIFFPTMGGAAVGDDDIGLQALRVRAAENHVWLVVAHRGDGAMIISPRGKIVATAQGPDGLAIADIDPHGGRAGGDSSNWQQDMRARLFRERNAEAFGILTDPQPPVVDKVPLDITAKEAGRIFARMLTIGEEEFQQAAALAQAGKTTEAIAAFERLQKEYRGTWIDRAAVARLIKLKEHQLQPK